jgi:hypothetical protein
MGFTLADRPLGEDSETNTRDAGHGGQAMRYRGTLTAEVSDRGLLTDLRNEDRSASCRTRQTGSLCSPEEEFTKICRFSLTKFQIQLFCVFRDKRVSCAQATGVLPGSGSGRLWSD